MILHYRDTGQRVDEVLYQTVIEHIERAQELESAIKGAEVICNIATTEKRELEKQNKRMREQLKLIISDTHCKEHEYVSVRHLIRKRAQKTLEGEK